MQDCNDSRGKGVTDGAVLRVTMSYSAFLPPPTCTVFVILNHISHKSQQDRILFFVRGGKKVFG